MTTSEVPYVVFGYGSLIFKPPPHVLSQVPGFLKGYVRRFAQKSHDHRGTPEVPCLLSAPRPRSMLIASTVICAHWHWQNPGRVVTLVHKVDWDAFSGSDPFPDDDVVWGALSIRPLCCPQIIQDGLPGIAYTIDPLYESEVRDYLDYREKDGYTLEMLDVYGIEDGIEKVVVHNAFCYVGRNDNSSFIGSEQIDALADRIWHSVGPSGRNKDYLYELSAAVRQLAPESHDSHLSALEMRCREWDRNTRK